MNRAMILAAGRGQRMGELTTHCPKSLLRIGEQYLIEHAILSIRQAGIDEIVINVSYHGDQIKAALGDGSHYGVKIFYSEEPERLETGGGIFQALPLLGNQPFLVMSSDIITDFPLADLPQYPDGLAHLVMVSNPVFHTQGDFGLSEGRIEMNAEPKLTYANIGIFRPEIFANCTPGHFRLTQVLNPAIADKQVTGEQYQGTWYNIGTAADLEEVRHMLLRKFDSCY
jgi:MurNAc alpha-1-phosphate uridylyltransferase